MKNHYILFLVVLVMSCTEKDKFDDYTLYVRNNSGNEFNLFTYREGILVDNLKLQNGERGLKCSYESGSFLGYGRCGIDSIKIVFPNNKGYLCGDLNNETFCFGNQINPYFFNEKFINTNGETYEFTITQQDFENAFDLE